MDAITSQEGFGGVKSTTYEKWFENLVMKLQ